MSAASGEYSAAQTWVTSFFEGAPDGQRPRLRPAGIVTSAGLAFDDLAHHARIVRGKPLVIPSHDGGVTGVMNNGGERLPIQIVEADHPCRTIDSSFPVSPHDNAAVRMFQSAIHVDAA